jgi:hypothetical protein
MSGITIHLHISALSEGVSLVFLKSILAAAGTEDLRAYMISQVKVFGSFATGLYLPTSDVDVSSFVYFELIFLNVNRYQVLRESHSWIVVLCCE